MEQGAVLSDQGTTETAVAQPHEAHARKASEPPKKKIIKSFKKTTTSSATTTPSL